MRTGGGMILVVVGLVLLWIVVTGRLDKLVLAWQTLQGTATATTTGTSTTVTPGNISTPTTTTPSVGSYVTSYTGGALPAMAIATNRAPVASASG